MNYIIREVDDNLDIYGIMYDSRSLEYKSPYGASPVENEISFSIKVSKDLASSVKMIIVTRDGSVIKDMIKNGSFKDGSDKWSTSYTPSKIGNYSYYFVVSNGEDIKFYGDDNGYFGTGKVGNLGDIKNYEFNVYREDFKTPDWLKNGIIYQIFPDRFFNGDKDNDYIQKYARGKTPYEFTDNWYSKPENPELEGNQVYGNYPDEARGDGEWSNELYGGDIKGISKKIDYLKALGVTVLYLTPIGQSISNHRYDTTDYSKVDSQLGNMEDFINLAKISQENGMHIILDGVYNHVSDDSIYFDRYGKYIAKNKPLGGYQYWSKVYDEININALNQEEAEIKVREYFASIGITDIHYKDWFKIDNIKVPVKDKNGNETLESYYQYEGWWGYDSMPVIKDLNGSEYQVKSWADEIIDGKDSVSREWLRNGSNGWRLDVANEVSDETWRAFRDAVKEEGDNAIIGEIWTDASNYILGDMYDSVMNYRFRGAILNFVKGTQDDNKTITSAKDSINELEKMREQYPREAMEAMMNLVDSHDTQRILSALDGWGKNQRGFAPEATDLAKKKMRLIPFLQMTYIGAPTIYYGDEIGMVGCDDPDNRRAFTWGIGDKKLVEWYARFAAIRNSYSSLRTGDITMAEVQENYEDDVIAYIRSDLESKALVAINRQENNIEATVKTPGIPDETKIINLLNTEEIYIVDNGEVKVAIPALNGVILVDNIKEILLNYDALADAYNGNKIDNRTINRK